ncbi:MAG: hypothetical protein NT154_04100 [Verrucomicrobia bacterium]|nr:hypothetical protein [Verrucomicrobiota bacterium]
MLEVNNSKYAKKSWMAKRYDVSVRTIETWMRAGLLVFIRVRRVVRFDVQACDKSLLECGYLS